MKPTQSLILLVRRRRRRGVDGVLVIEIEVGPLGMIDLGAWNWLVILRAQSRLQHFVLV